MKTCCVLLVCLLATSSLALVQVVSMDPVKAAWRGAVDTLPPNNVVGQGIVCNFDTPVYAEFFTGTATGEQYQVKMVIPGSSPEFVIAQGDTSIAGDHRWIRCYFKDIVADSIIKGRTYNVLWTLGGGSLDFVASGIRIA